MTLIRICSLLAGLLLGAPALLAADLGDGRPVRPPRDFSPPPEYRDIGPWSGFYLGATVGYGRGQNRTDGDFGPYSFDQSGALGTVFAGYNWQIGRTVLGVEADIGTGNLKSSTATPLGTFSSDLQTMGSVRARAGFLLTPALLLYGTGGFAWANYDLGLDTGAHTTQTFTGYQLGIGSELMLTSNVTMRLEYLYTDLGREVITAGGLTNGYNPDFHTVRAGVAIKF